MRRILAVFIGFFALAAVSAGAFFFLPSPQKEIISEKTPGLLPTFFGKKTLPNDVSAPSDLAPPPSHNSLLTGLPREYFQNPEKIFAVMIEESVAARSKYRGMEAAKILFEMPAEGGIPRFSAIFSAEDIPSEIGPVRSARDYFVEMIAPIASAITHAGGSPAAFEFLAQSDIIDFNHGSEDDVRFLRNPDILPPHNLFLQTEEISEEIPENTLGKSVFVFSQELPDGASATDIEVDFSTESHRVNYTFDSEKNCYQRLQKYEVVDLCFANIAVMETEMWLLEDNTDKGRLGVRTTGNGKVTIFRNGIVVAGQWERSKDETIRFVNGEGDDIALNPGTTIISAIDKSEKLRFSGQ